MVTPQPPKPTARPLVLLVTIQATSQAHARQVIAELRAHPDVTRVTVLKRTSKGQ